LELGIPSPTLLQRIVSAGQISSLPIEPDESFQLEVEQTSSSPLNSAAEKVKKGERGYNQSVNQQEYEKLDLPASANKPTLIKPSENLKPPYWPHVQVNKTGRYRQGFILHLWSDSFHCKCIALSFWHPVTCNHDSGTSRQKGKFLF